jgi:hypothetical protein
VGPTNNFCSPPKSCYWYSTVRTRSTVGSDVLYVHTYIQLLLLHRPPQRPLRHTCPSVARSLLSLVDRRNTFQLDSFLYYVILKRYQRISPTSRCSSQDQVHVSPSWSQPLASRDHKVKTLCRSSGRCFLTMRQQPKQI